MMSIKNIFKKTLGINLVMAMLLPASVALAEPKCADICMAPEKLGEATRKTCNSCVISQQSAFIQKGKQGCLLTVPFDNPSAPGVNISSVPGQRNGRMHQGMDVGTGGNETLRIISPAAGKVHQVTSTYSGGGRVVISHHPLSQSNRMWSSDCDFYETRFLHLYRFLVSGGAKLSQGTPIGIVGGSNYKGGVLYEANNASYSTPPDKANGYAIHMHYEVRSCKNNIISPLSDEAQNLCNDVQQDVVNPDDIPMDPEIIADMEKQARQSKSGINYNAGSTGAYDYAAGQAGAESSSCYLSCDQSITGASNCRQICTSKHSCNIADHDEYFESCVFCDIFKVLFNAASQLAKKSHDIFAASLIPLLGVGLAISLAWMIMQYVADMRQQYFGKMLNDIFKKIFIVAIIILLLKLDVVSLFNMFITPIITTGFNLASAMTTSANSSIQCAGADAWGLDGSGLPADIGSSMLCAIESIQNRLEKLMALGSNSLCIAFYVKSWHGWWIFPHVGYLLTGLLLWITALVFMLAYPCLLIDSVLQFTIASALLPVALASSAFKPTYQYLNVFKIINIFITAIFVFIFLTVILFILLAGIDRVVMPMMQIAYEGAQIQGGIKDSLFWYSRSFVELVFFLFLGKTVLEEIPGFAQEYAKALSLGQSGGKADMGIGRKVVAPVPELAQKGAEWAGGKALGVTKFAGREVKNFVKSARHSYLLDKTQSKMQQDAGGKQPIASNWASGRTWYGRKVQRRVIIDENGNKVLESKRKSWSGKVIHNSDDGVVSITKKMAKKGQYSETYSIKNSHLQRMFNADGTINKETIKELRETTSLSQEQLDKIILNQMLKQRMRGIDMESHRFFQKNDFKSETVNTYTDSKGREVFEVRRTDKKGNVKVYKMVKGDTRYLVEAETINKKGEAKKWSSDGALNKKENYKYDLDENGLPTYNAQATRTTGEIESAGVKHARIVISGQTINDATINNNGEVFQNGQLIGKLQGNGDILDAKGEHAGSVDMTNVTVKKDENGNTLVSEKIKVVMGADGMVYDQNHQVLGHVRADGQVVNDEGGDVKVLGTMQNLPLQFDRDGNVIGKRLDSGLVIDKDGKIIGGMVNGRFSDYIGDIKEIAENSPDLLRDAKIKGATHASFSHSRAFKGSTFFDVDGVRAYETRKVELMFDDDDLALYREQMIKYGDVLRQSRFIG